MKMKIRQSPIYQKLYYLVKKLRNFLNCLRNEIFTLHPPTGTISCLNNGVGRNLGKVGRSIKNI